MAAGAVASAGAWLDRWQWAEVNLHTAMMLDWDDVQAVVTRMMAVDEADGSLSGDAALVALLRRYQEKGATHLSIPELTLNRLLQRGELTVSQGPAAERVYLLARDSAVADLVAAELQARLPHLDVTLTPAQNPLISFRGDLPTVAEVGLGFNPAHAELARQAGLQPAPRPIGYSWVQPTMIERTLDQAASLGVRLIAFQGRLIPGHEFNIQATVEAMRRNQLTYAYFRESRHQKGDWFLAKHLAADGLVILAHEFEPDELLAEDWFTVSYRWANLAVEAGVRLYSVRFFRILHAADPLESLAYVEELARALRHAGLWHDGHAGAVDLTPYQLQRDPLRLSWAGLSIAGAAGLAADLLPVGESLKTAAIVAASLALTGLPLLENSNHGQPHLHLHSNGHHHHHHDQDHHHDDHHHDHGHHHHPPDRTAITAYAPKGLSLAAAVLYPAAAVAANGAGPAAALAHNLAVAVAGATALTAITTENDYLLGIEEYRSYNLDWFIPLGLAVFSGFNKSQITNYKITNCKVHIPYPISPLPLPNSSFTPAPLALPARASVRAGASVLHPSSFKLWRWLSLVSLGLLFFKNLNRDLLAWLDREHRHAHTHHLSAFQRLVGDLKMAFSARPLRKWTLLAPLGAVVAVLLRRHRQDDLAAAALTAVAMGQVATLTGFRNGQRPILKTAEGRGRGWLIGLFIAGLIWLAYSILGRSK